MEKENRFLYKTKKGNYFLLNTTICQGEVDYIEPVSESEAMSRWEQLREKHIEYEEAFGVKAEEA